MQKPSFTQVKDLDSVILLKLSYSDLLEALRTAPRLADDSSFWRNKLAKENDIRVYLNVCFFSFSPNYCSSLNPFIIFLIKNIKISMSPIHSFKKIESLIF